MLPAEFGQLSVSQPNSECFDLFSVFLRFLFKRSQTTKRHAINIFALMLSSVSGFAVWLQL